MKMEMSKTKEALMVADCELTELTRGVDRGWMDQFAALVRGQNVSLDLKRVERIDATGIAALISLYGFARDAGHSFAVENARPHVAEMLALVGLDRILMQQDTVLESNACMEQTAA
jgi:anti-anti-sigma factor